MKRLPCLFLALAFVPAAWAFQDAKDKPKPDTPDKASSVAEQVKALQAEYTKAQNEATAKYRAAKTAEERNAAARDLSKPAATFLPKFIEIGEKHAADPASAAALAWVVQNHRAKPEGRKAMDLLLQHHLNNPQLGAVCIALQRSGPADDGEKFLRTVLDRSSEPANQGKACYTLAILLHGNAQTIQRIKDADAEMRVRFVNAYGKETIDKLLKSDLAVLEKEVESLLDQVVAKHSDVELGSAADGKKRTVGGEAKVQLFEIRNLAIGKVAPEIVGEDTDGKPIKLTDYRGKVVVLDFWGHW